MRDLQRNPVFRRVVTIGVVVSTIALLALLLVQGRAELRQIHSWRDCWIALGRGFLLYGISLSMQALTWSMMIARVAQIAGGWRDIEIYAHTHLMRRLPGGIWYLAGRAIVYGELGVERAVTLAASGLEWLLLLLAAGLVWGTSRLLMGTEWWLGVLIPVGAVGACAGIGYWIVTHRTTLRPGLPNFARRWLDAWSFTSAVPRARELALWTGAYATAYGIGGVILFLLVSSLDPRASVTLADAVSIWALTGGVASLISTILPSGLGVRELTLTALLTPAVATTRAIVIALLLRALFIVGDLVWGGGLWYVARAQRQRRRP